MFSTLHTNNAAGVIPRLIDMGVDPYLIAPTLIMAMAQRLVSTLPKPGQGKPVPVDGSVKAIIDREFADIAPDVLAKIKIPEQVYEPLPTQDNPRGTKGRAAVVEVLVMDKDIENAILHTPTELEISKLLRKKGMFTMREDAMLKAFQGIIPFEEVTRL